MGHIVRAHLTNKAGDLKLLWGIHQRRLLLHEFEPIKSPYWLTSNYTGYLEFQCNPEPFLGWTFKYKNHVMDWHSQLTRTVIQKQNYKIQRGRLVYLETFPDHGLWRVGSLFYFWKVMLSRCWVLQIEWYFNHGVSCAKVLETTKIWGPVIKIIFQDIMIGKD